MRGLFITGTDTDVGKTHIAALLLRELRECGMRVGAYKPVCSGAETDENGGRCWSDIERLSAALESRFDSHRICPQRFMAPLAPPVAARLEHREVDEALLLDGARWWRDQVDLLLVEGAGGLLCPISTHWTVTDLAERLQFPLIIVAAQKLGVINHTLLSVAVARQRRLPIAGIILNERHAGVGDWRESNIAEITSRCDVPILATLAHQSQDDVALHGLQPLGQVERIDWTGLASGGLLRQLP